jgi:hypothetical protein
MIRSDTRAVSIALNYTIAIGITTILTTGLLISAGTLLESQQERVARLQADEIAADLLTQADRLDRISDSTVSSKTTLQLEYPSTLLGRSYTVSFQRQAAQFDDVEWTLRIDSTELSVEAVYPVPESIDVAESSTRGANPTLSQCPNGNITFGGC